MDPASQARWVFYFTFHATVSPAHFPGTSFAARTHSCIITHRFRECLSCAFVYILGLELWTPGKSPRCSVEWGSGSVCSPTLNTRLSSSLLVPFPPALLLNMPIILSKLAKGQRLPGSVVDGYRAPQGLCSPISAEDDLQPGLAAARGFGALGSFQVCQKAAEPGASWSTALPCRASGPRVGDPEETGEGHLLAFSGACPRTQAHENSYELLRIT